MARAKIEKCSSCKKGIKTHSRVDGLCLACYEEKEKKEKKKYVNKFAKQCSNDINEMAEYFYNLEKRLKQIETDLAYIVFKGEY